MDMLWARVRYTHVSPNVFSAICENLLVCLFNTFSHEPALSKLILRFAENLSEAKKLF